MVSPDETKKIGVIGAGAWGTAFSIHLARKGFSVLLWVYEKDLYNILKEYRENRFYLPGFIIPDEINYTDSLKDIAVFSHDIVIATPSFAFRKTIENIPDTLKHKRILILTKGMETETLKFMSDIVFELVGIDSHVAVLSGPSFAKEVAQSQFTSVVVASLEKEISIYFQNLIHSDKFRVYTTDDLVGVELGGAMKNVMAIGAGIIEGLSLGTNTKSAFITRALAEIKRLGKAIGAKDSTFMGLSGMGDLILTSYGALSRNRAFGIEMAKGKKPDEILKAQKSVVEGYFAIKAAYMLSKKKNVEMPITEELFKIVYEGKSIFESLNDIKARALKEEEH